MIPQPPPEKIEVVDGWEYNDDKKDDNKMINALIIQRNKTNAVQIPHEEPFKEETIIGFTSNDNNP
jgi:hypothetical protein